MTKTMPKDGVFLQIWEYRGAIHGQELKIDGDQLYRLREEEVASHHNGRFIPERSSTDWEECDDHTGLESAFCKEVRYFRYIQVSKETKTLELLRGKRDE